MPALLGLLVIAIGLILIHYGVTGAAFPLAPINTPAPISSLGSVTSTQ